MRLKTNGVLGAVLFAISLHSVAVAGPREDAEAADDRGDYAAELAILQPNADQGLAWAENQLGDLYTDGHGLPLDYAKAASWYRKAAEQGDPAAETNLGQMYAQGHGPRRDVVQAEAWIRKAGDQGYDLASVAIMELTEPEGSPQETFAKAARWRKAGDGGDGISRKLLEALCGSPQFFFPPAPAPPTDCAELAVWARSSAEEGDASAMKELGRMYDLGESGLAKDPIKATYWIRRAAEGSDPEAEEMLAERYRSGTGIGQDLALAIAWYRKAADHGDETALREMARRCELGDGVAKDDAQSFHWNSLLADRDSVLAQKKVAMAYALGQGVKQDYVQAYRWYANTLPLIGETSDAEAIAFAGLTARLTPTQLAEARELAGRADVNDRARYAARLKAENLDFWPPAK